MEYIRSKKYFTPDLQTKIMGPNPIKLQEELLQNHKIPSGSYVCDLGSGQGLTSVFLAKEYGFVVFAVDLWSEPKENEEFFKKMGLSSAQIKSVKADANELKFEKEFFDAVVSTDSYNYFGRDPIYLDEKLLPFVKKGGFVYITVPGMKKDCHEKLPEELLLSWTPEELDYIHDITYWSNVSAKYSCGFPDPQALPIIVVDRYLDYFTTIMEDRLWQVLAKPVFRWRNRFGLSMNAARAA